MASASALQQSNTHLPLRERTKRLRQVNSLDERRARKTLWGLLRGVHRFTGVGRRSRDSGQMTLGERDASLALPDEFHLGPKSQQLQPLAHELLGGLAPLRFLHRIRELQ